MKKRGHVLLERTQASVATIATALGRTSDRLYYHLRLLARARLIGPAERAEILKLLERMLVLLGRGRSARRDQLTSFTWVLAPLRAHPVRRRGSRSR